ncbi:hypothetical protein P8C59_009522 [Phyllachora maydis]|uniref:Uncharacterized protein n=1 Tax=Phyllachora maydis TaxID=1825666 RepID=A0AAD9MJV2_9PEZI|nr:hypothetical protein P8C59_009522 [Phyllachora maydis]
MVSRISCKVTQPIDSFYGRGNQSATAKGATATHREERAREWDATSAGGGTRQMPTAPDSVAHNVWFDEMRFGDTDCTPRTPAEG